MANFISVSYRRTFNIGNYESISFEATVAVDTETNESGAIEAAQLFVQEQFNGWHGPQAVAVPVPQTTPQPAQDKPASESQRNFIDKLMRNIGYSPDQIAALAAERDMDMLTLTKFQASQLIDVLKDIDNGTLPF